MAEKKPLEVECPACQAKPGQPCTQPTETGRRDVKWFHESRVDKAGGWD